MQALVASLDDMVDQDTHLVLAAGILLDRRADWDNAAKGRSIGTYAVNYIIRGHGVFHDADTPEQAVAPGSMFLLRPGVWHRFAPDTTWDEYYLCFDGTAVRAAFGDLLPGPPGHRNRPPDPLLQHAFEQLHDLWLERPRHYDVLSRQHLHTILLRWWEVWSGDAPEAGDSLVAQAKAFLKAHLDAPAIDLRRFARERGISWERLRKRFVAVTGQPPHRFWMLMKLRHASLLLRSSGISIAAAGQAVGIDDPAYFSRLFARHIGLPPARYRERERACPPPGGGCRCISHPDPCKIGAHADLQTA